ncbi:hypothetical protein BIY26_05140 [Brenneria goodwinii]|uniref:Uncharacterized protein n=1 Tax=Brenneria goodwinii TaxID=1109412 RepID=A0AAE8ETN9_9GAMM|nr:hypothetical protein [Brenneria goodwinii]ATA25832.1 hypothetical protein AWC36_17900 [Brenneria goodwinii]MCG8155933.1 hypothetical protein [Brenneria goodwinii]MCG8162326.1 hypothetical protein [Brenneria goodwinii]MCG8166953.1 hypothetical protein [Brenneria goodwinii]MCG8169627.1 hypothetical protein [Brenneria goodwinii]
MSYERISYDEIRDSFLRYYYIYCRNKLDSFNRRGEGWSEHESEIGYAYYQFENAYELEIENLMLNVLTLVLMAGRGPEQVEKNLRKDIKDMLSEHKLDELIADISEEERQDLIYDMSLLKLI